MKRTLLIAALITGGMTQAQDLPAPSPAATVSQRVGLTDISIEYSRPSKRDREIFGDLVPFNKMWRTGANANTTIEFNTAVNIGGTDVKPGKYALLTIPREGEWTIILNRKTDMWGTNGYSEDQNVMSYEAEAEEIDEIETFTILFSDIKTNSADIMLIWDETAVRLPVKVKVDEQAIANIEKAIEESKKEDKWRVYRNAANYYYNNGKDMEQAQKYIDMSIESNEKTWYSHWLRAEILAERGEKDEAIESANRAIELGQEEAETSGSEFEYAGRIKSSIEKWQDS